jgi:hypothetical protein
MPVGTSNGNSRTEDGDGRALVVANEAVVGAELREKLLGQFGEGIGEVFVVAPAIADSGLGHVLGDIDRAIGPAEERLRQTLAELRRAGVPANGEVGDSDPLQAIQDELSKFHPDQIVVIAHRDEDGAFAERGLLEQAERDLELPVAELVVDGMPEPHVVGVKHSERGAERDRDWRPSSNWPPMTTRNVLGIVVAVVGTVLLAILAAKAVGDASGRELEESRLGASEAATILIAIGIALINLAHVVGLFLFQSVGYDGMWSRFFSRLSLAGTPVAVAIVAVLAFFV